MEAKEPQHFPGIKWEKQIKRISGNVKVIEVVSLGEEKAELWYLERLPKRKESFKPADISFH